MLTSSYLPAPGRFLVSEPFMEDLNFQRTVVLLVEHNAQGTLGFVMNRSFNLSLHEVIANVNPVECPVCMGGPVEPNTLHFVHRLGKLVPDSHEILPGLFWGGDFGALRSLINAGKVGADEAVFFIGYSGWSPGQLEQEIQRKSWIVAPGNTEFVFRHDDGDLWRSVLQSLGDKYKVISNYPVDPRLN